MRKLDTLNLYHFEITLEQLSTLFRSCPELVELSVELDFGQKLKKWMMAGKMNLERVSRNLNS